MPTVHDISSVDWKAIGTNFGVFLAVGGAVCGGIWTGIKRIVRSPAATAVPEGTLRLASATLVESTTMLMWSESNRSVCESVTDLDKTMIQILNELRELRHSMELDRALRIKG